MRKIFVLLFMVFALMGCESEQDKKDKIEAQQLQERIMQQDRLDHEERMAEGRARHLYNMAKMNYEHIAIVAKDAAEAARVWWDKMFKLADEWIMPLIAGAGFLGAFYAYLMLFARTIKDIQQNVISGRLALNKQNFIHDLWQSMSETERQEYIKSDCFSPKSFKSLPPTNQGV